MMRGGAHLSRYLVQCAIHHYFRTQVPFIKTRWVRTIPLPVFTKFLSIASDMYGEVPVGKGDDDGTILTLYLKQSKFPIEYRAAKWEQVRDVIEKYKVRGSTSIIGAVALTTGGCSSFHSQIGCGMIFVWRT